MNTQERDDIAEWRARFAKLSDEHYEAIKELAILRERLSSALDVINTISKERDDLRAEVMQWRPDNPF